MQGVHEPKVERILEPAGGLPLRAYWDNIAAQIFFFFLSIRQRFQDLSITFVHGPRIFGQFPVVFAVGN
jgi:hypothetical protein